MGDITVTRRGKSSFTFRTEHPRAGGCSWLVDPHGVLTLGYYPSQKGGGGGVPRTPPGDKLKGVVYVAVAVGRLHRLSKLARRTAASRASWTSARRPGPLRRVSPQGRGGGRTHRVRVFSSVWTKSLLVRHFGKSFFAVCYYFLWNLTVICFELKNSESLTHSDVSFIIARAAFEYISAARVFMCLQCACGHLLSVNACPVKRGVPQSNHSSSFANR